MSTPPAGGFGIICTPTTSAAEATLIVMKWWVCGARDARLITGEAHLEIEVPRPAGFVPGPAPEAQFAASQSSDGRPEGQVP